MTRSYETRSRTASVARWLGLQVASKAVSVALGLPAVAGLALGVVAYLDQLPLTWILLAVVLMAACVAVTINQARAFILAYSVKNKIEVVTAHIQLANDRKGAGGYGLAVIFRNTADIPLEFHVERQVAHLNGTVALRHARGDYVDRFVMRPRSQIAHVIGLALMNDLISQMVEGEIEVDFAYGKPGRLTHSGHYKATLYLTTKPDGHPHTIAVAPR